MTGSGMRLCDHPHGGVLVHRGPPAGSDGFAPCPPLPALWRHGVPECKWNLVFCCCCFFLHTDIQESSLSQNRKRRVLLSSVSQTIKQHVSKEIPPGVCFVEFLRRDERAAGHNDPSIWPSLTQVAPVSSLSCWSITSLLKWLHVILFEVPQAQSIHPSIHPRDFHSTAFRCACSTWRTPTCCLWAVWW